MTTPNDRNEAATDPRAAAQQEQVKADHDALVDSARRVEASVPSNQQPATDARAAAKQDQVKADHDALVDSARRVEASVPAEVRDTPVQPANFTEDEERKRRSTGVSFKKFFLDLRNLSFFSANHGVRGRLTDRAIAPSDLTKRKEPP